MQILDDLSNFGVKDIFDIYAGVQRAKIDQGIARSNSQIAEWNAQGALAMAQAQAAMAYQPFGNTGLSNGALMIAALAVVAVGVVFAVKAK